MCAVATVLLSCCHSRWRVHRANRAHTHTNQEGALTIVRCFFFFRFFIPFRHIINAHATIQNYLNMAHEPTLRYAYYCFRFFLFVTLAVSVCVCASCASIYSFPSSAHKIQCVCVCALYFFSQMTTLSRCRQFDPTPEEITKFPIIHFDE